MSIPPFLGNVGIIKVVSVFLFWALEVQFFVPKSGHFCQKCPFQEPKNGTLGARTNSETTFISPTLPNNGGIDIYFERISLLSNILDDFLFQVFRVIFG